MNTNGNMFAQFPSDFTLQGVTTSCKVGYLEAIRVLILLQSWSQKCTLGNCEHAWLIEMVLHVEEFLQDFEVGMVVSCT